MNNNAWIDKVDPKSLNLGGLSEFVFSKEEIDTIHAETEKEKAEYRAKYGDDWWRKWVEHVCHPHDYDDDLKFYNTVIYHGTPLMVCGRFDVRQKTMAEFEKRCREVYGDEYEMLKFHVYGDPHVVDLLIEDAIRTGKWKELPDEIQDAYHRRVGDDV